MNGPCAKQRVTCIIKQPDGREWYGENICANPQSVCPRAGMPSGVGYELCISVCQQVGHAEIVALQAANGHTSGATAIVYGHTYCCKNCTAALNAAGINNIIIGHPQQ